MDLSIVVAVYNEHPNNLAKLLACVNKVLSPLGLTYEVVFVNDGSRLETSNALRDLVHKENNIQLVELSRNFGQQAAISAGLDHARGKAIVNIDSDLQDPPELIPEMLKYWRAGYDVVYAQRISRRDGRMKRFSAYLFYRLLGSISSVKIPWDTGDFRLIDAGVVNALNKLPEKTRFLRGQIPWLGFRQIGIPIDRGAREEGESTYTLKKLLTLALDGLLSFSSFPLHLIISVGLFIFCIGFLASILSFCSQQKFFFGINQIVFSLDNFALLSILALLSGLQIICLGLIAIYLSKTLDEVRARPTYLVSKVLESSSCHDQNEERRLTSFKHEQGHERELTEQVIS